MTAAPDLPSPAPPVRAGHTARVHLALLVVQVAFGALAVEGKLAMSPRYGVSPLALGMARIAGGALVFLVAHLALGTPRVRRLGDALELGLLALFGIVLNQALFLAGLERTTPVAATLLVATIPVFTALFAALAGKDRISPRGGLGIALALVGIAALSGFALPGRGDALVLLNAASYALYVVFARRMLARYGTVTVVAWIFGWGALLFAPVGAVALGREVPAWTPGAAALVAFVVAVPTVLAYGLNAWALGRASPTLVTIYIYLQPLVVVLLAWVQLGQALDARTALAALCILAGVTLVAAPRVNRAAPAPSRAA